MNKFVAIALLAFAAPMVLAQLDETDSQAAVVPSDDEEISALDSNTKIFSDFCIKSRDDLVNDIKKRGNNQASLVFKLFFNNAQEIAQDALNTNKIATEQLANQIANPDAPMPEGVDINVAAGLSKIQAAQIQPQSIVNAFVSNLRAVSSNVVGNLRGRIETLRSGMTTSEFAGALVGACGQVAQYNKEFKDKFNAVKAEMGAPGSVFINFADVKCMTTQRVSRLEGLCNFVNVARGPLMQIFGRA